LTRLAGGWYVCPVTRRSNRTRITTGARLAAIAVFAVIAAFAMWLWREPGEASHEPISPAPTARAHSTPAVGAAQRGVPRRAPDAGPDRAMEPHDVAAPDHQAEPIERDARFWRETADIEDFKRAIYALEIDTIDEIPQLDALVAVEVDDPLTLWDTDWAGVDDWKRYRDGFSLERGPDGSLLFHPGEETQRMFTFFEGISLYEWDESNGAFVNQVEYYGKPIYNVVKFLREDVLVMMTISGHKVDLNIFEQGDYR